MICSDYSIVPAALAIRRPFSEDMNGTGQITFLTCAPAEVILEVQERGEWPSAVQQSNKVQTVWTKEWQKQDVADQRGEKKNEFVYLTQRLCSTCNFLK